MDNSQLESLLQDLESDILEQNQRTVEQQLASVRFTTRIQTPIFPTNLGALVIGKELRQFVPGAYIQLVIIRRHP